MKEPRDPSGDENEAPTCPYCPHPRDIEEMYDDGPTYTDTCGARLCVRAADEAGDDDDTPPRRFVSRIHPDDMARIVASLHTVGE